MFTYKEWDKICKAFAQEGFLSVPAKEVLRAEKAFLTLKHDVETAPSKALVLAEIESKYGHRGSFYVQAYLLSDPKNVATLHRIQDLGHEVSYHHDVMDHCSGVLTAALEEFAKNKELFEGNGFETITVCQHGNPMIKREGYTSNRDFFRDAGIAIKYSGVYDIM